MHASKQDWKRYPQFKPTKGPGYYKVITADGKVIPAFAWKGGWDKNYILAFIDANVQSPKSFLPNVHEAPKSLYREFMDAGKYSSSNDYTQFTDVESPAQIPIKNQLNQLLGLLPDDTALEQLSTSLQTFKTMAGSMDFESPSNEMELFQLIDDILALRELTKSVRARVDGLNRDLHIDTKSNNEPRP